MAARLCDNASPRGDSDRRQRGRFHELARFTGVRQQRLYFPPQDLVAVTSFGQERRPLARRPIQRRLAQRLDLFPALRLHGNYFR